MKFKLKKDWYIEDFFDKVKIYDAGHIFSPDENEKYIINGPNNSEMSLSYDEMIKSNNNDELRFELIEELELIVEEIKDEELEEVKKWRIQLDVNTTQLKLKEIQKFIQENIPDML